MSNNYNGYSLPVDEPILDQDVKPGDYHHSTDPRGIDTYIVEVPALPGEQPHYAEVPVTTGRTSFFDVTFQSANTHMGPAPQILPHENNYYFDISYDSKNGGSTVKGATLHDASVLENHAVLSGTFDQMTQDLVAIFTPSILHDPLTGEGIHATRTAGFGTDYGWHGQSQTDNYIINYDDHQTLLHALLDSQIIPPSFFSVSFGGAYTPRDKGMTEAMFADLRAYIVEHIPRLPTYDAKSHSWTNPIDGIAPGTTYAELVHNYTDLMKQTILDPREYFKWEINKYFYHMGYDGNQNFQTPEIQAFIQPALQYLGQEEVNKLVQKAFTEGAIQKEKDKPVSFLRVAAGIVIGIATIIFAPELGAFVNEAMGVTVAGSEAAAAAAAAADGVAFESGAAIGADAMIGTMSATTIANNFTGTFLINAVTNGGDLGAAFQNAGINALSAGMGGIMGQAFDGSKLAQTLGNSFTNAALRGDNPLTAAAQSLVQYEVASTLGSITQNAGQVMPDNVQQGLGNLAAQGLVRQNVDFNQLINAFIPTGPSKPQQPTAEQMQTQQAVNQAFNTMDQQNLNAADGADGFVTPPALLQQQVNEANFNAQQARQAMNDIFNSQAALGNGLQVGSKTLDDGSKVTFFQNGVAPAFIRTYQDGATVFNSGNGTGGYGTDAEGNVFGWGSRANQDAAFALARQQGDSTFAFDKGDGKGMQPYNTTTAAEVQAAQRAAQQQAAARAEQLAQQQQQQAASQSSVSAAPADAGGGRGSVIPPTVNSSEFAAQQNEQNNAGRGSINPPTVNSPQFAAQQAEQNNTGRGSINPPTVNSSQFAAQQAEMNARPTDSQPVAFNPAGDFTGGAQIAGQGANPIGNYLNHELSGAVQYTANQFNGAHLPSNQESNSTTASAPAPTSGGNIFDRAFNSIVSNPAFQQYSNDSVNGQLGQFAAIGAAQTSDLGGGLTGAKQVAELATHGDQRTGEQLTPLQMAGSAVQLGVNLGGGPLVEGAIRVGGQVVSHIPGVSTAVSEAGNVVKTGVEFFTGTPITTEQAAAQIGSRSGSVAADSAAARTGAEGGAGTTPLATHSAEPVETAQPAHVFDPEITRPDLNLQRIMQEANAAPNVGTLISESPVGFTAQYSRDMMNNYSRTWTVQPQNVAADFIRDQDAYLNAMVKSGAMTPEAAIAARQSVAQEARTFIDNNVFKADSYDVNNLLNRFSTNSSLAPVEAITPAAGRIAADGGGYHLAENAGFASTTPQEINAALQRIQEVPTVVSQDRIDKIANSLTSKSPEEIAAQLDQRNVSLYDHANQMGALIEVRPLDGALGQADSSRSLASLDPKVIGNPLYTPTLDHELNHLSTALNEGPIGNGRSVYWFPLGEQAAARSAEVFGPKIGSYATDGYILDEIARAKDSAANMFIGVQDYVVNQNLRGAEYMLGQIDARVTRIEGMVQQQNANLSQASQIIQNYPQLIATRIDGEVLRVAIPVETEGVRGSMVFQFAAETPMSDVPAALQATIQAQQNDLLRMAQGAEAQLRLSTEMRAALPTAMDQAAVKYGSGAQ